MISGMTRRPAAIGAGSILLVFAVKVWSTAQMDREPIFRPMKEWGNGQPFFNPGMGEWLAVFLFIVVGTTLIIQFLYFPALAWVLSLFGLAIG
ncbi:MAG: hypothetical protein ACRC56_11860 [Bosea sp. (in: a-proteobacteria)]